MGNKNSCPKDTHTVVVEAGAPEPAVFDWMSMLLFAPLCTLHEQLHACLGFYMSSFKCSDCVARAWLHDIAVSLRVALNCTRACGRDGQADSVG